jgi:hypothetical protein
MPSLQEARRAFKMGLGRKPQDGRSNGAMNMSDCHFWLVDKEGNIIDPTPPEYDRKRHYKPFKYNQKIYFKFWWNQYKKHPRKQYMLDNYYENPEKCKCMYNVFVYWKKHKDCKIVVGSLGYELNRGSIFWEFG